MTKGQSHISARVSGLLLRHNVSTGQTVGFIAANLVGMLIILVAVQFYCDLRAAFTHDNDRLLGADYIVLSKPVKGIGGLFASPRTGFTTDEVKHIATQPWARETGAFTAADFDVFASIDLGGRPLSTSLFLETVPDGFLDIDTRDWHYDPAKGGAVPVILPKDYLALYNFGYASSHGLPQMSESMMAMLPLRLTLSGNGHTDAVAARIVGFSSRLNTIVVPSTFLDYANNRYSASSQKQPERLIIKVTDRNDPAIETYLKGNGIEMAGDNGTAGQLNSLMRIIVAIVVAVGLVITLLSFFILLLSVYLLIQKSRDKIRTLNMLGYTPKAIARVYIYRIVMLNVATAVAAVAITMICRMAWTSRFEEISISTASPWVMIATAAVLTALFTLLHTLAVMRRVRGAFV